MPNVRSGIFVQLGSTVPGFTANSSLASAALALESTLRVWLGPVNRAVRVSSIGTNDFYLAFGTSVITASTSLSMLFNSPGTEIFGVKAAQTYIAFVATTTDVSFNVTLGSIA
jgi:hypothetical protein